VWRALHCGQLSVSVADQSSVSCVRQRSLRAAL
jgi:hypothetical protein